MLDIIVGILFFVALIVVFKYRVLPRFRGYPTDIVIFEEREGENLKAYFDKGRRVVEGEGKEKHEYELKRGGRTKPINLKHLIPTNKGNDLAILYSASVDDYKQVEIKKGEIEPINEDNRKWFTTEVKKINDIYRSRSFWDKYGQLISTLTVILVLMGCTVMIINNVGELVKTVNSGLENVGSQLSNVANKLDDVAKGTQRAEPTTPTEPVPEAPLH